MVENDTNTRALAARKEKIADEVLDLIGEVCDDDAVRDELAPTAVERSEMNTPNKIIYQIAVRL